MLKIKYAKEGYIFAYIDEKGEEIILGNTLFLGVNDDGSRYYEIPDPNYISDSNNDIIVDNATEDVVE